MSLKFCGIAFFFPGVRSTNNLRSMTRLWGVILGLVLLPVLAASPPIERDSRVQEFMHSLEMKPLPKESGYLGLIGQSAQTIPDGKRNLAIQSQVYYMLTRDKPINYLHWLAPDDTHILIEGGPVDYFIFCPERRAWKVTLGPDVAHGERGLVAVPGGCWKALKLHPNAKYALMANVLTPEFTADRVRIGAGQHWVQRFAGSAPWATPDFLRELIGPNWQPAD